MQMTAGRISRWISRHKKICFPCAEPGQELCESPQEIKGVSERCATTSVSWIVCDFGGSREEGGEPGVPLEEAGGLVWVLPDASCPRWSVGEWGRSGGVTCSACSVCIKWWLLIKTIEKSANQKCFTRTLQFCTCKSSTNNQSSLSYSGV